MLPDRGSTNMVYPMPAVCRFGSGSFETADHGNRQEIGSLEMWICTGCGLTEWYAVDVNATLSYLSRNSQSGVTFVDGGTQAPYRAILGRVHPSKWTPELGRAVVRRGAGRPDELEDRDQPCPSGASLSSPVSS